MLFLRFTPALLLVVAASAADAAPGQDGLVAHEWGTFTSVAGEQGQSLAWAPLSGKPDLPCFVNRLGRQNFKLSMASVRMETPVLYFYSSRQLALSVHVAFPQGWITEWYPKATKISPASLAVELAPYANGEADWKNIEISPGENAQFPTGKGASRYYAARNTDSATLQIGGEREKMIFYRGVGGFAIPLKPRFATDGSLEIQNAGTEPIPLAILFENRSGKIGYRVTRGLKNNVNLDPPELTGSVALLRHQMEEMLVEFGLYRKEALAMLETWNDSWFEEGTRLIYLVPRATVDSILPLTISPAPIATARVFVGRIELLSPSVRQTIATALTRGDVPMLAQYGRFLQPFLGEMKVDFMQQAQATRSYLSEAFGRIQQEFDRASCVQ